MFIMTKDGWARLGQTVHVHNDLDDDRRNAEVAADEGLRQWTRYAGEVRYGKDTPEKRAAADQWADILYQVLRPTYMRLRHAA